MPAAQCTTDFVPGSPRIAYDHAGRGPGVLFLHGIGGNRSNWRDQLPALGARYHAVAWDARGYGLSDDVAGDWQFPEFSRDLLRVLDHLQWESAHLVGLSMGGRIAQDFYERHPQRVQSLVLCDTLPAAESPPRELDREEFLRLRRQPLLDGKQPRDIAPAVARTLIGRGASPEHWDRLIESLSSLRKESYLKILEVVTRYEPAQPPRRIAVPTLLVFGEDDRLTPPEIGRRMHAQIPGSRLELIADAGHLVNIERPQEFNRIVSDFLGEVCAGGVQGKRRA
jgi:3-oxoadipate enol-lactonase